MEAPKLKATANNLKGMTVDELLADEQIRIVLNLSTPQAHAEITIRALNAGKHFYCEKPLAVEINNGKKVVTLAKEKGLLLGCAPDTFLAGGHQTCRKLIDDGVIGKSIAYHVLEGMHAFLESSESGKHILFESTCERPDMLPLNYKRL